MGQHGLTWVNMGQHGSTGERRVTVSLWTVCTGHCVYKIVGSSVCIQSSVSVRSVCVILYVFVGSSVCVILYVHDCLCLCDRLCVYDCLCLYDSMCV